MAFYEDLLQLSERITSLKENISTEEATKMSMIVPFFQLLGYDVFNPNEFCPEYTADIGIKKGEKVDYAVIFDEEPTILIECKSCTESLDKHASQLFRYFGTTAAKFGILTNGIIYKFYTDLDESNKMDLLPFLEIDIENLKEQSANELKKFSKLSFDKDSIFSTASELKYSGLIKDVMRAEIDSPSDEFVRFFLNLTYDGIKTQKIVEKFGPIVKKSLSSFINELVNQKITSALNANKSEQENEASTNEPTKESKIVTTDEELQAYYIVRGFMVEVTNISEIAYRDAESYFSVLYQDNNRKPICRINLDVRSKYIMIPTTDKGFEKYFISSVDEIYNYKDKLIEVCKRYI